MKQRMQNFILLLVVFFLQTTTTKSDVEEAKKSYENKDYQTAFKSFLSDAEEGIAEAEFYVGLLYDFGRGVPKDKVKAKEWYLKAAGQGYLKAMHNLGELYRLYDYDTPHKEKRRRDKEAEKWYGKAVEKGYAASQYRFAVKHIRFALGNSHHQAEAEKWLLKSASQGYGPAQYDLGMMYIRGQGKIPKDINKARELFIEASEFGDARAQEAIGTLYHEGLGFSKDLALAYMWYTISVKSGLPIQKRFMSSLEKKLTPDQIENARNMAKDWKKEHPPLWE